MTPALWWWVGLAVLWAPGVLITLAERGWATAPTWGEYTLMAAAAAVSLFYSPPAQVTAWAVLVLYALPTSVARLKAVTPHGGTVYLLRRRAGCWPASRAGWVFYVGSTDDWARRLGEHQDDRRDDWGEWKRDISWADSGPAWFTFTRSGAARLENRVIKLMAYGVRIRALPPIENVAATKLRRGPHPWLWVRIKRAKYLDGTCMLGRRFHLTPTKADTGMSATAPAGGYPDAIDVEGWEHEAEDDPSPGSTGSAAPPEGTASPAADTGSPWESSASPTHGSDRSPPPDSCHPTSSVPAVPFHPAVSSHPSHPTSTPVGGGTEMPDTWDAGTPDAPWDGMPDDDATDPWGGDADDDPEPPEPKTKRTRKRTGGRRSSAAGRGGSSGVPGWVPIARKVVREGGTVTDAWHAVKDAGHDAARSTVGRWVKDA